VLQFGFGQGVDNPHRFDRHVENRLVYTGTHDNDTTAGWWASRSGIERSAVRRALERAGIVDDDPVWGLIRLSFASPARVAIVPMQDVLELGSEARMNMPGSAEGNWRWRLRGDELTDALAARVRQAAEAAERA
jgi:4-alpha-glucanotransferase